MATAFVALGLFLAVIASLAILTQRVPHRVAWSMSSLVLPVVCLPFYYVNWHYVRKSLIVVHCIGIGLMIGGLTLIVKDRPEWLAFLTPQAGQAKSETVLQAEKFQDLALKTQNTESRVSGTVEGERFYVEHAEWLEGSLRLRDHEDALSAETEIVIDLDRNVDQLPANWRLHITPNSANPPMVHLTRSQPGETYPSTISFNGGYRLLVELKGRDQNRLQGFVQISLPHDETLVGGYFNAYTNRLRFVGDHVDRSFDSIDTLHYVAEESLPQLVSGVDRIVSFDQTRIHYHRGGRTASTDAGVRLANGALETYELNFSKAGGEWYLEQPEDLPSLADVNRSIEETPPAAAAMPEKTWITPQDLLLHFDQYQGQTVRLRLENGGQQQGRLSAKQHDKIALVSTIGNGEAEFFIPAEKITLIEFLR